MSDKKHGTFELPIYIDYKGTVSTVPPEREHDGRAVTMNLTFEGEFKAATWHSEQLKVVVDKETGEEFLGIPMHMLDACAISDIYGDGNA